MPPAGPSARPDPNLHFASRPRGQIPVRLTVQLFGGKRVPFGTSLEISSRLSFVGFSFAVVGTLENDDDDDSMVDRRFPLCQVFVDCILLEPEPCICSRRTQNQFTT